MGAHVHKSPIFAIGLAIVLSGCSGGEGDSAAVAALPSTAAPVVPTILPVGPAEGVDLEVLRLGAPEGEVVVEARGAPFIRAGEYDAWLGTYPLNVTATDELDAERQALDQMVTFRFLLESAVAAGYETNEGESSDARSIVLRYLGDQIRNVAGVSDAEAERHFDQNRQQLGALESAEIPREIRMAALKGSVRGLQLSRRIEEKKKAAGVRILLSRSSSEERAEHEKPR